MRQWLPGRVGFTCIWGLSACVLAQGAACSSSPRSFGDAQSGEGGDAGSAEHAGNAGRAGGAGGKGSAGAGAGRSGAAGDGGESDNAGAAGADQAGSGGDAGAGNNGAGAGGTSGGAGAGGTSGGAGASAGSGGSTNYCAPTSPCQNSGTCSNGASTYTCACTANFTGKSCELSRFEVLPVTTPFIPSGISADGTVIIGDRAGATKYVAGKVTDLGKYTGDTGSTALGVNQNGSLIVGYSSVKVSTVFTYHPVTWAGATISLLPGGSNCQAWDVSADGTVIAGLCSGAVVRWVNGVYEDLALAGAGGFSNLKISRDGVWIAGTYTSAGSSTGFVWSKAGGLKLATIAGKFSQCSFAGISANGALAIGNCNYTGNIKVGVTWDSTNGLQLFPGVDTTTPAASRTDGISNDGSYISGRQTLSVRWDSARTPHELSTLVPAALVAGWKFDNTPIYLSGDGATLTGQIYNPLGSGGDQLFVMRTGN